MNKKQKLIVRIIAIVLAVLMIGSIFGIILSTARF